MDVVEKLHWLTDREEGLGIPLSIIAQRAHCTGAALGNYLRGVSKPNASISICLEQAIQELKNIMATKILN